MTLCKQGYLIGILNINTLMLHVKLQLNSVTEKVCVGLHIWTCQFSSGKLDWRTEIPGHENRQTKQSTGQCDIYT